MASNGNLENICGESNIALSRGQSKKITFPLTNSSNFVCNYNFQKSDSSSNRISILMQKNEAERLMNQQKIVILNFLI